MPNNLNISLGVDLSNLKKGFEDAIKITSGASKKTESEAKHMADAITAQFEKIGKQSTMRGAIRQMENLAGSMQQFGMEGTKAFNEVIKQTGRLKDEQQDLKALIQTGGPAGAFIAMNNAMKVAVGGVNAVQGAMALLGADSKELQATMVKLQAGMAFAQGLKELEGLKDVMTQLNFVMKANPIIAVAAAFAGLIGVVIALSSAETDAERVASNLNKANDVAFDHSIKEKASLEQLLSVYNDKNTTDTERLNIQKQIVQDYPTYLGQISTEKVEQEKVNAAVTSYIKLLDLKAQAQAFQEMYVEALKEERKITKEAEKTRASASVSPMSALLRNAGAMTNEDDIKKAKTNVASLKSEWDNLVKAAWAAENAQKQAFGAPPTAPTKTSAAPKKPEYKSQFSDTNPFTGLQGTGIKASKEVDLLNTSLINVGISQDEYMKKMQEMKQVSIDVGAVLKSSITTGISDMATALGTAIATGEDFGKAIGQSLLTAMANFMKQLGEMFIAAGTAKLGFDSAMIAIGGAPLAIAAGAALVAASAITTAKLQQSTAPQHFAQGGIANGIVGGSSFHGDRVHAMVNSGEMILNAGQQKNLWAIANGRGSSGGFVAETRIDGRDMYLLVKKAEKDYSRA